MFLGVAYFLGKMHSCGLAFVILASVLQDWRKPFKWVRAKELHKTLSCMGKAAPTVCFRSFVLKDVAACAVAQEPFN